MGKILKGIGRVAKRAFTKDGGSLVKLSNEFDEIDGIALGAVLARIAAIILTGLAIYFMNEAGLPGGEIIESGKEALGN